MARPKKDDPKEKIVKLQVESKIRENDPLWIEQVQIKIANDAGPAGGWAVPVSVNGYRYNIPRNQWEIVPKAVYLALVNGCVETHFEPHKEFDGQEISQVWKPRDVPRFNVQMQPVTEAIEGGQ